MLAALNAAHDADPNHPETLEAIITFMIANQTLTQAAQNAERLMKQSGWELRGMVLLARVRHELLEPAAAAKLLTEALKHEPEMAHSGTEPREVRRLLATCLLETSQPGEALRPARKSPGMRLRSVCLVAPKSLVSHGGEARRGKSSARSITAVRHQ